MSLTVLVQLTPRGSDGGPHVLRVCARAGRRADFLGVQWWPELITAPAIESTLGFDGANFGQGATPQVTQIKIALTEYTRPFAALQWVGAPVSVQAAAWPEGSNDPGDGAFTPIWSGRVAAVTADDGSALSLTVTDAGDLMRKPFLTRLFGSTNIPLLDGADAGAQTGQPVPAGYGELFTVPGILVDKVNLVYLFLGNPVTSLSLFSDGGASFGGGQPRGSYADLVANTPAPGTVDWCPNAGGLFLARPWTLPAHRLTVDCVCGSTRPADIAAALVAATPGFVAGATAPVPGAAGITCRPGAADALNALQPGPAGLRITDQSTTAGLLDQLLGPMGCWWKLRGDGTVDLRQWSYSAAPTDLTGFSLLKHQRKATVAPTWRRTLGWKRNQSLMGDADISKALTVANMADNLIPAPGDPTTWTLTGRAIFASIGQDRPASIAHAALLGNFDSSVWETPMLPSSSPGESVWFQHAVTADLYVTAGTDNARGGIDCYDPLGNLIGAVDVPGSAVAASECLGRWVVRNGSATLLPGTAAFRPYSIRQGSSGGTIRVGEALCSRAQPGATVGADFGSNLANVPPSLSDGRVAAAISSSGALQPGAAVAQVSGSPVAVALEPITIVAKDGQVVNFANYGVSYGGTPDIAADLRTLPALASGQSYAIEGLQASPSGFTAQAQVRAVATGSPVVLNAGGITHPSADVVEANKGDSRDAIDGYYNLRLQGTVNGTYVAATRGIPGEPGNPASMNGGLTLDVYVLPSGGVWTYVSSVQVVPQGTASGVQSWDQTFSVRYAGAIGTVSGADFRVVLSARQGTAATDKISQLVSINWQAPTSTPTSTPLSQAVAFIVTPRNG